MNQNVPTPAVWFTHRVSYGETDTMGYLYYAEYLHIFERARSAFIRNLGMSYREVETRGMMLPVREATCRYRYPAKYDDVLQVHTSLQTIGRASLVFAYDVMDETRTKLLAQGVTEHACANLEGKPMRMPNWFKELLQY